MKSCALTVFLFYLGCLLVANVVLAGESSNTGESDDLQTGHRAALAGKRLFFEAQERISSDPLLELAENPMHGGGQINKVEAIATVSVRPESPAVNRRHVPESRSIRYDARFESAGSIRVILNGVPCDRVDRRQHQLVRSDNTLVCRSLKNSGLQIVLLTDGRSLRVVRDAVVLGVLAPGQKL